ncbi:MAG: DNA polymerase IV [Desulfovibrionaceae bacterium]
MDAFFASVEQLDNPELRGKPVAVGGTSDRGVISAASYEIRKYGVRSAMPAVQARRLCPQGIFLPGRMSRYKEKSREVMAVLRSFSPVVEQASVDEAYLDATGLEGLFGPVEDLGRRIKAEVKRATGLTCSVGAAPVRFLAKIASDMDKPDGLYIIRPEQVEPFLRSLPVGRIPGVGKRAAETLAAYGVEFAADVLRHPPAFWEQHLGRMGLALCDRARGIDPSGVTPETEIKSCSAENTFDKDLLDREALSRWLLRQADRVAADLRRHGKAGRTVTIKLKFNDFKQITRSHTLPDPVNDTRSIHRAALELLGKVTLHRPLRLIGVGVSGFGQRERSLSLLDERSPRKDAGLESAVDEVRRRFGGAAVRRASLKDFD